MRWLKQQNEYSCGPIAILNVQKWLGRKISYKRDYPYWKKRCCTQRWGSPVDCFVNSLHSIKNVTVTPRRLPTVELIDEALLAEKAVVMKSAYVFGKVLYSHYYLVSDRNKSSFFCVNVWGEHRWISKEKFDKWLLQYHRWHCEDCGVAPYAWLVKSLYT